MSQLTLLKVVFLGIFLLFNVSINAQVVPTNSALERALSNKKPAEVVILIPGLMRGAWSLWFLKNYLKGQGYDVYYYSYPSAQYSIHEHSKLLANFLEHFMKTHPDSKIHFVTHSLGGIILREPLSNMSAEKRRKIGNFVMLAPPNQGSVYAKWVSKLVPGANKIVKPLSELSSDPQSYVHKLPIPKVKMGIIAGRNDSKTPPAATYLNKNVEQVIVNANHGFIMNNKDAWKYISLFLKNGTFSASSS